MNWTHTGLAQRVHFGAGTVRAINEVVREAGGRRVLLISTKGRLASEAGEQLTARLGRTLSAVYDGVRSHVPTDTVQQALGIARDRDADCIVSLFFQLSNFRT